MHPILVDFDLFGLLSKPFTLHTYGALIASGFLVAMALVRRRSIVEGEDPDQINDIAFYLLLSGLIGSRIIFIMTRWSEDYSHDPLKVFKFWEGGLVFYGGPIAAGLFLFYYCKKHKLNFLKLTDMLIPFLAMAHVFGRLGCLAAGCCFGKPTEMPWGIVFPDGSMPHSAHLREGLIAHGEHATAIHPTQLYESGFELLLFGFLLWMRDRKRFHGQIFLTWLVIYPIFRSFVETLRGDSLRGVWFWGLSTSQIISAVVAIFAIWLFIFLRRSQKPTPTVLDT